MDLDVIFWLVVGGFYLLRMLTGGKGKNGKKPVPAQPQPDLSHIETVAKGATSDAPVPSAQMAETIPDAVPEAAQELGHVLDELRAAFGLGSPKPPVKAPTTRRDVEVFGGSEEQFEKAKRVMDRGARKEESFEKRPAYFVSDSDRENAFEKRKAFSSGSDFSEDAFEKRPASSEVEFRNRWTGHTSDFEYHSPLEKHGDRPKTIAPAPTTTAKKSSRLSSKLEKATYLQKAVLLHEIFSSPVSQRTRSAHRRPS